MRRVIAMVTAAAAGDSMPNHSLISRRALLQVGGAAAASVALNRIQPVLAKPDALSFVAIGDWGHANAKARAVAAAMGNTAAKIGSRFVISVGDNFYPHGVSDVNDRQWTETFEQTFSEPSLMTPWNVIAGNHDHHGNALAQVEYGRANNRWRMPSLYYKRTEQLPDQSRADFFYIDTELMRNDNTGRRRPALQYNAQEQLRWLEGELSISRAAWKIVVGHHPVYSGGKHGSTKRLVEWLTPLFKRYGVQVYLAGHNHNLEHLVVDGTHYLVSGGGAEPNRVSSLDTAEFGSGRLGFLAARLSADSMRIKFVNENGKSLYKATIPLSV